MSLYPGFSNFAQSLKIGEVDYKKTNDVSNHSQNFTPKIISANQGEQARAAADGILRAEEEYYNHKRAVKGFS